MGKLWWLNSSPDWRILGTSHACGVTKGQTPALQLDYVDSPSIAPHFSSLTHAVSHLAGDKFSMLGHAKGHGLILTGAHTLKYCIPPNATPLDEQLAALRVSGQSKRCPGPLQTPRRENRLRAKHPHPHSCQVLTLARDRSSPLPARKQDARVAGTQKGSTRGPRRGYLECRPQQRQKRGKSKQAPI